MSKKLALAGVVLAVVAAIVTYLASPMPINEAISVVLAGDDANSGTAQRAPRAVAVEIATLDQAPADTVLPLAGEIVAADQITLTSEVSGRIEEIFITDGQEVDVGEPIIRFDDDNEEAAVAAAETALAEAREEKERIDRLVSENVVAEARQEEAATGLERARSELAAARVALDDRTVRTPFAGEVGMVPVSPGTVLSPGAPIAELATTRDLRARFAVPERHGNTIETGDALQLGTSDGRTIDSEIAVISPIVDPMTRSIEVEARLGGETGLRPGAFVRVGLVLERRPDALFAPQTAILREGRTTALFKIVDDTARRVQIETGIRKGERIEVRGEGLAAGTPVVASGLQKIEDGTPVVDHERTRDRPEGSS